MTDVPSSSRLLGLLLELFHHKRPAFTVAQTFEARAKLVAAVGLEGITDEWHFYFIRLPLCATFVAIVARTTTALLLTLKTFVACFHACFVVLLPAVRHGIRGCYEHKSVGHCALGLSFELCSTR